VAGEIGGFKREIALVGDAMNTAARLEQACRTTGHAFLASKPLLDRTLMPGGIVATSIGSHLLRGKAERLELFALERDPSDGSTAIMTLRRVLPTSTLRARAPPGSRRLSMPNDNCGLTRLPDRVAMNG
jgi:hypothetical protein